MWSCWVIQLSRFFICCNYIMSCSQESWIDSLPSRTSLNWVCTSEINLFKNRAILVWSINVRQSARGGLRNQMQFSFDNVLRGTLRAGEVFILVRLYVCLLAFLPSHSALSFLSLIKILFQFSLLFIPSAPTLKFAATCGLSSICSCLRPESINSLFAR